MLLECIAMSAFSSNFSLSKKFRTLFSILYNFIGVSQAQTGDLEFPS